MSKTWKKKQRNCVHVLWLCRGEIVCMATKHLEKKNILMCDKIRIFGVRPGSHFWTARNIHGKIENPLFLRFCLAVQSQAKEMPSQALFNYCQFSFIVCCLPKQSTLVEWSAIQKVAIRLLFQKFDGQIRKFFSSRAAGSYPSLDCTLTHFTNLTKCVRVKISISNSNRFHDVDYITEILCHRKIFKS